MTPTPDDGAPRTFVDLAGDALRFWEARRVVYNAVLLAVVALEYLATWPESRAFVTSDSLLFYFILAVLANIAYSAVYVVDLFVQFSGLRQAWKRWRWTLLVVGTAFAAALTHFWMSAILRGDF